MTSVRQQAANRRNAARSTGPKSECGKAIAAKNARSHGLTAAPPESEVEAWLRIILNRAILPPTETILRHEGLRRAHRLAEAEARLAALRERLPSETGSLENGDPIETAIQATRNEIRATIVAAREGSISAVEAWSVVDVQVAWQRHFVRLQKHAPRYLAEARAARRRAFKDWIEWQRACTA